jgi:hypothetical protein
MSVENRIINARHFGLTEEFDDLSEKFSYSTLKKYSENTEHNFSPVEKIRIPVNNIEAPAEYIFNTTENINPSERIYSDKIRIFIRVRNITVKGMLLLKCHI